MSIEEIRKKVRHMCEEEGLQFFFAVPNASEWNINDCAHLKKLVKYHKDLETEMTLTEFMNDRYKNREDKNNIFGVGVSDAEFRKFIIEYLLGEDWCVTDPLGITQINEIALYEILEKYSRRYRKECLAESRDRK